MSVHETCFTVLSCMKSHKKSSSFLLLLPFIRKVYMLDHMLLKSEELELFCCPWEGCCWRS